MKFPYLWGTIGQSGDHPLEFGWESCEGRKQPSRGPMVIFRTGFFLFAFVAAMACSSLARLSHTHPPRAQAGELRRGVATELIGKEAAQKIMIIAHKAGACDAYPHQLGKNGIPQVPLPASALLDHEDLGHFDAVEIDARADAQGANAYVSHDPVTDLPKSAQSFLDEDRLGDAVQRFFKKHPTKHLFIELKVEKRDHVGVNHADRLLASAVLAEFERVEKALPSGAATGRITFISFTPGALQALYEKAENDPNAMRFQYHIILGTDIGYIECNSDLPSISDQKKELVKKHITGVWFSTRSIRSPETTLKEIQESNAGIKDFIADAYLDKLEKLEKAFGKLTKAQIPITGLVFDSVIDDKRTSGIFCPKINW